MPAVATTINAKLVLNGSQYAQELERTKGLTTRSLRDIEKTQSRITEQTRAKQLVGLQGPAREQMQTRFAEQDALSKAAASFEKIKADAMAAFKKTYMGTDSMEGRVQLAAATRQAIAEARNRYDQETAAVRARYAAERAEIQRTASAAKAASHDRDPYTGMHGYRQAPKDGLNRELSRSKAGFLELAAKAYMAKETVVAVFRVGSAAVKAFRGDIESAQKTLEGMAFTGEANKVGRRVGEWLSDRFIEKGAYAKRDEAVKAQEESDRRAKIDQENIRKRQAATAETRRMLQESQLASADPETAATIRVQQYREQEGEKLRATGLDKSSAEYKSRQAAINSTAYSMQAQAWREQEEREISMRAEIDTRRASLTNNSLQAELIQIRAGYDAKRVTAGQAMQRYYDELQALDEAAAQKRDTQRRQQLADETKLGEMKAAAGPNATVAQRLAIEEEQIRASYRNRLAMADDYERQQLQRQQASDLKTVRDRANEDYRRQADERMGIETSIGQKILQLNGRNTEAQLLGFRESYRTRIEEAMRAGDTEKARMLSIDQQLAEQQARTQGSSTMQVQAGRFAVGSASRNAPMRIEGDPKQTKLFEEIRDALLKPSYARAS